MEPCPHHSGIEAELKNLDRQRAAQWSKIEGNHECLVRKIDSLREEIAELAVRMEENRGAVRVSMARISGLSGLVGFVVSLVTTLVALLIRGGSRQ